MAASLKSGMVKVWSGTSLPYLLPYPFTIPSYHTLLPYPLTIPSQISLQICVSTYISIPSINLSPYPFLYALRGLLSSTLGGFLVLSCCAMCQKENINCIIWLSSVRAPTFLHLPCECSLLSTSLFSSLPLFSPRLSSSFLFSSLLFLSLSLSLSLSLFSLSLSLLVLVLSGSQLSQVYIA